jgi:hypothetical protein
MSTCTEPGCEYDAVREGRCRLHLITWDEVAITTSLPRRMLDYVKKTADHYGADVAEVIRYFAITGYESERAHERRWDALGRAETGRARRAHLDRATPRAKTLELWKCTCGTFAIDAATIEARRGRSSRTTPLCPYCGTSTVERL